MKMIREASLAATLAAAITLSSAVVAQSGALTLPNNSAGTPLDGATPVAPRDLPSRTQSADAAFVMLDTQGRGYVTRADVSRLPRALRFDEADRNRDGVLDLVEFERAWKELDANRQ